MTLRAVRRIIQNVRSREYFRSGQWTADPEQAQQFSDSGKVIDTCLKYHLREVELVLQLEGEPAGAFETRVRLFDELPVSSSLL